MEVGIIWISNNGFQCDLHLVVIDFGTFDFAAQGQAIKVTLKVRNRFYQGHCFVPRLTLQSVEHPRSIFQASWVRSVLDDRLTFGSDSSKSAEANDTVPMLCSHHRGTALLCRVARIGSTVWKKSVGFPQRQRYFWPIQGYRTVTE